MKNIAILTSGGDCSGMNAAIYYALKEAKKNHFNVYGVFNGYKGLLEDDIEEIDYRDLKNLKGSGGTILGSARVGNFREIEIQKKAYENLLKRDIDTLIVLGGDGSFKGADALRNLGLRVFGIPCTIDNDIFYTDYSIGFHTSVEMCGIGIRAIRDTMFSHGRVGIIETMGRHNGEIALYSGILNNADITLIPEVSFDIDNVVNEIKSWYQEGKNYGIIVISEGVMHASELKEILSKKLEGIDIKDNNLGHIQRGGDTVFQDITLAKRFSKHIFKLIKKDIYNRAIGIKDNKIIDIDINKIDDYKSHDNNEYMYNMIKVGK